MAITKLLHQKECKGTPSRHLKNAIYYILNPQKTEQGLLIGGNCGVTPQEVYQAMLQTKREFQKTNGRQGYHFVISFRPGEADWETAYQIGQEFCDRYLQDRYDYVYAVHTDRAHLHIHILFNSVSLEGRKYHYAPGDWKKQVQPVTNRICKRYGLAEMQLEDAEKGISYGEWNAQKQHKQSNRDLVRKDINAALASVHNYAGFLKQMAEWGYQIRAGFSRKHEVYLAFRPPGAQRAYRSYTLGGAFSPEALQKRAGMIADTGNPTPRIKGIQVYGPWRKPRALSSFQYRMVANYYRCGLRIRSPKESSYAHRKDIRKVDRLARQCRYLLTHAIDSPKRLLDQKEQIRQQEKELQAEIRALQLQEEELAIVQTYQRIRQQYDQWPDREELLDQMETYLQTYPLAEWERREALAKDLQGQLQQMRKEKRLLQQVEKELQGEEAWKEERTKQVDLYRRTKEKPQRKKEKPKEREGKR